MAKVERDFSLVVSAGVFGAGLVSNSGAGMLMVSGAGALGYQYFHFGTVRPGLASSSTVSVSSWGRAEESPEHRCSPTERATTTNPQYDPPME